MCMRTTAGPVEPTQRFLICFGVKDTNNHSLSLIGSDSVCSFLFFPCGRTCAHTCRARAHAHNTTLRTYSLSLSRFY
jgi:hypothetical protein